MNDKLVLFGNFYFLVGSFCSVIFYYCKPSENPSIHPPHPEGSLTCYKTISCASTCYIFSHYFLRKRTLGWISSSYLHPTLEVCPLRPSFFTNLALCIFALLTSYCKLPDLNVLYALRHAPNIYEIHPWTVNLLFFQPFSHFIFIVCLYTTTKNIWIIIL
jgi:hypothetical protein